MQQRVRKEEIVWKEEIYSPVIPLFAKTTLYIPSLDLPREDQQHQRWRLSQDQVALGKNDLGEGITSPQPASVTTSFKSTCGNLSFQHSKRCCGPFLGAGDCPQDCRNSFWLSPA